MDSRQWNGSDDRELGDPPDAPIVDGVTVSNYGSVLLLRPTSGEVEDWLRASVSQSGQWWAGALVVEPRYVGDILSGLLAAGFRVQV